MKTLPILVIRKLLAKNTFLTRRMIQVNCNWMIDIQSLLKSFFKSSQSKNNYFIRISLYIQTFKVSFYPKFLSFEDSRPAVESLCFFDNFTWARYTFNFIIWEFLRNVLVVELRLKLFFFMQRRMKTIRSDRYVESRCLRFFVN